MYQSPYQPQGYQQPYGFQPAKPKRSAIPITIGILLIVFGGLGLIGALIGVATAGVSHTDKIAYEDYTGILAALEAIERTEMIFKVIAIPVSLVEIFAGIMCVTYRRGAPMFAFGYSIFSGLHTLAHAIVMYAIMKPMLERAQDAVENVPGFRAIMSITSMGFGITLMFGTILGLAWPIIAGILMTRGGARKDCVN